MYAIDQYLGINPAIVKMVCENKYGCKTGLSSQHCSNDQSQHCSNDQKTIIVYSLFLFISKIYS